MLTAVLLGFVLGLRHAADPDHVAAVLASAARHRGGRAAAGLGAAWGAGHGLAVLAAGGVVVALSLAVPARLALSLELAVGLALLALGAANLRLAQRATASPQAAGRGRQSSPRRCARRAFLMGGLHGLAGSAPLALLALLAMPSPAAAGVYLLVFSLGAVAGMTALSLGLGWPLGWAAARGSPRLVLAGSGAFSLACGAYLIAATGLASPGLP